MSCRICHIFTKRFSPKFAVAETRRAPLPSALRGCGTQSTQRLYGLPLWEITHYRLGLSKFFNSRFSDGEIRKFWKLQIW